MNLLLVLAIWFLQTPAAKPQFEVASIKAAPVTSTPGRAAMPEMARTLRRNNRAPGWIPMPDPGRVRIEDWPLLDLIATAYKVHVTQVSGPDWISEGGFDIDAKIPEGTKKEQVNAMLQSLLEERFGLQIHRETQNKSGFALIIGKNGPKLKPAEPEPAEGERLTPEQREAQQKKVRAQMAAMMERMQDRRQAGTTGGANTGSWSSVTTAELATHLVGLAGGPVVDETGLTGKYSVFIETWQNAELPGGTVFDAVEKLGLKLMPRKVDVDTIVIDHVSKTPTAN